MNPTFVEAMLSKFHLLEKDQITALRALLEQQHKQLTATAAHERLALIEQQACDLYLFSLGLTIKAMQEHIVGDSHVGDVVPRQRKDLIDDALMDAHVIVAQLRALRDDLGVGADLLERMVDIAQIVRPQPYRDPSTGRFQGFNERLEGYAADIARVRETLGKLRREEARDEDSAPAVEEPVAVEPTADLVPTAA